MIFPHLMRGKRRGFRLPREAAGSRVMSTKRPLEAQRQKNDRLAGGKVACSIVFDREFKAEEMRRFYCLPADENPKPLDFTFDGRVLRFVCSEEDEPKWRLALDDLPGQDLPRKPRPIV